MRQWVPVAWVGILVAMLLLAGTAAGIAQQSGADRVDPVEPRALNASQVECSTCHDYIPANTTPRQLNITLELLQVSPVRLNLTQERFEEINQSHPKTLDHGDYWCLECHETTERELLVLENDTTLQYSPSNSSLLCQQCHANLYSDWQDHIHGRWVGNWSDPEPGQYCVDCHDPHDTHPAFHQIEAEPAPEPPAPKSQSQGLLPPNFGFIAGIGVAGAFALIGYAMTGGRRFR